MPKVSYLLRNKEYFCGLFSIFLSKGAAWCWAKTSPAQEEEPTHMSHVHWLPCAGSRIFPPLRGLSSRFGQGVENIHRTSHTNDSGRPEMFHFLSDACRARQWRQSRHFGENLIDHPTTLLPWGMGIPQIDISRHHEKIDRQLGRVATRGGNN